MGERVYQRYSIRSSVESNRDRTHLCRISCHFHLMDEFFWGENPPIPLPLRCPPARIRESFARFWNDNRSLIHRPYTPEQKFARKGADSPPLLQSSFWKNPRKQKGRRARIGATGDSPSPPSVIGKFAGSLKIEFQISGIVFRYSNES